ncbi:hypothetical protein [Yersinia artesiana]|uniref:hypothetical protein n=1 Tax=Yersinia artesiana TaxID=2890315 RepID=UPI00158342DF|nr:hypothetical protein [Yersinia artesiana]
MSIIYQPNDIKAGTDITSGIRRELLCRRRVGKKGLPLHVVRGDEIKTRWTESEAAAIKSTASAMGSNSAVETHVAAIRGFLDMFDENPAMLIHVHTELDSAGLLAPAWLPVPPVNVEVAQ